MSIRDFKRLEVREVMEKAVTNTKDASLEVVYSQISASPSEMVEIVDDQNILVGIATKTAMTRGLLEHGKRAPIDRAMYKNPFSIRGDKTVEEAIETMNEKRVDKLPVVDSEGKAIGVISRSGIMKQIGRFLSIRL